MKALHLLAMSAAMAALLVFAAVEAGAQSRPVGGGRPIPPPGHGGGKHGIHGGVFIVEREVGRVVEREVVRDDRPSEQPVAVAAPAPPRKPYVIGSTYASLPPQGCMKLIDDGVSYFYCSGEWYRQMGGGRDAQYRAVAQP